MTLSGSIRYMIITYPRQSSHSNKTESRYGWYSVYTVKRHNPWKWTTQQNELSRFRIACLSTWYWLDVQGLACNTTQRRSRSRATSKKYIRNQEPYDEWGAAYGVREVRRCKNQELQIPVVLLPLLSRWNSRDRGSKVSVDDVWFIRVLEGIFMSMVFLDSVLTGRKVMST